MWVYSGLLLHEVPTIIEVDGGYHDAQQDELRDGVLWRKGYETLRFTNSEVEGDFVSAHARILAAIEHAVSSGRHAVGKRVSASDP
jgi:very-short-patch-repair endonuclease